MEQCSHVGGIHSYARLKTGSPDYIQGLHFESNKQFVKLLLILQFPPGYKITIHLHTLHWLVYKIQRNIKINNKCIFCNTETKHKVNFFSI